MIGKTKKSGLLRIISTLLSLFLAGAIAALSACGSGDQASGSSVVIDEGSAVFSINWYLSGYSEKAFALTTSRYQNARCAQAGVVGIHCNVYRSAGILVWQSDTWRCSDTHLIADPIPSGSDFQLNCFGVDENEEIVQAGQISILDIEAGETIDAGVLESFPFTARLISPQNRLHLDVNSFRLTWSSVPSAYQYRVEVSDSPYFAQPIIKKTTTETSCPANVLLPDTTYYWRVFALNRHGARGLPSETWTFTTRPGDICRAPSFAPIGNQTVAEGRPLAFFVIAMDPDENERLTFSADPLPGGAAFESGTISGVFTWSTTIGDRGNYPIRFQVCDACPSGPLCDSEEIVVSVGNICRPPVLTPIGDRHATIFTPFEFSISATAPDVDGALTYSAVTVDTDVEDNAAIAEKVFSPETRIFRWEDLNLDDVGHYRIKFKVCNDCSDGPLCDEEEIGLTIVLPPPEYYQGIWKVDDLAPHWLETIRIDSEKGSVNQHLPLIFDIRTDCSFPDCPQPVAVDSVEKIPIVLNYQYDGADITLKIFPLSAISLQIHEEIDYTEEDGREDVYNIYFPKRAP